MCLLYYMMIYSFVCALKLLSRHFQRHAQLITSKLKQSRFVCVRKVATGTLKRADDNDTE